MAVLLQHIRHLMHGILYSSIIAPERVPGVIIVVAFLESCWLEVRDNLLHAWYILPGIDYGLPELSRHVYHGYYRDPLYEYCGTKQ